ncbi:serine protease [Flavobacterium johnsoniae]|uniref:trypsin-like serine protease n=1 Tax=Flavobacterium johnsoniae TaxID=986 RepID=UPI0025B0500A|nr:trypsin-like serine protease [Flavobacterium johnsoniae]WJS94245.1 serine protease [Flavobacterium johnsoniae]
MKFKFFFAIATLWTAGCFGQEISSNKVFKEIALVNGIEFTNPKYDQPKFSCGFLLKYNNETFAVTAKHLLKIIKPEGMTTLSLESYIKNWALYPLNNKSEIVICDKLLNEDKSEKLEAKSTYDNDWLVFSIKESSSNIIPLEIRKTPLTQGEKLYVVGWTRTMENGPQRVYEFEYYKTIANRILLKDILVPEKFGGLSGAPLVDENGLLVGIVSNGTVDPDSNKKFFSPCSVTNLAAFLENRRYVKQ